MKLFLYNTKMYPSKYTSEKKGETEPKPNKKNKKRNSVKHWLVKCKKGAKYQSRIHGR